jgi:hypothetical protein
MVSAASEDKSYFRIGYISETTGRGATKNGHAITGSLFTFRESQGQPLLLKCTFLRNRDEITLRFGSAVRSSVSFKTRKYARTLTTKDLISTLRTDWIAEHSGKDKGYQKLELPSGFGSDIPVLLALSLATKETKKRGHLDVYASDIAFSPSEVTWFGPIRTEPIRTYDETSLTFSPQGKHTPYLIRRILRSKADASRLKKFIERVGEASGLFQSIRVKTFGPGVTARFELDIVLDGKAFNILNVGYGVSQSLPIIVELFARVPRSWFAIQEPEIHLHPRAQAALGDVLFEMAAIDHKCFLVETHSDFIIDRFRTKYRDGRARQPASQILFFERRHKHNVITPLPISNTGDLPVDQPESYRSFFVREQMNLLGL